MTFFSQIKEQQLAEVFWSEKVSNLPKANNMEQIWLKHLHL